MGKPSKKYSQAARLHNIIRLLEARFGATVEELAEECQVNRRTIYRDLQEISEAGYPLVREVEPDGRTLYRFLTGFKKVPPITFSLPELMTLYFCRGQLSFLEGTPFGDDLEAVFDRIRSALPPRNVAHLERIAEAVAPRFHGMRDYRSKREILDNLRRALLYQFRCTIRYTPVRRSAEDYLFDPYTLLFYKDSLYLGGFAHNRQGLRLFLVDRIQEIRLGEERFEVPDDFRVDQFTGSAFGLIDGEPMEVQVRFMPEVVPFVRERLWHATQSEKEEAAGSLILSFQAAGEKEILAWLYSFLPHVEVLSPPSLRSSFQEGLRTGMENHNRPPKPSQSY